MTGKVDPVLYSFDSNFMKSPIVKNALNDSQRIKKSELIVWGILLCKGSDIVKTRVLYDVLQDANQA